MKTIAPMALMLTSLTCLMGTTLCTVSQKDKEEVKPKKEFVTQPITSERIEEYLEKKYSNIPGVEFVKKSEGKGYMEFYVVRKRAVDTSVKALDNMEKRVQDSLKLDSVAQTNYVKGQQMVRGSLKKAKLEDIIKKTFH